jgi:hypothetical protein
MKPGGMYKGLIFIVIMIAAIALFWTWAEAGRNKPEEIPLSRAIEMSKNGEIAKIVVEEDALLITTTAATTDDPGFRTFKEANANIYDIEGLVLEGIEVEFSASHHLWWPVILHLPPGTRGQ